MRGTTADACSALKKVSLRPGAGFKDAPFQLRRMAVGSTFMLGFVLLFLANFALIVAAIIHALRRDDLTGAQRLIWIAIAFFITPVIALGAIVYFAMGRERTRELFRDVATPTAAPAPPTSRP